MQRRRFLVGFTALMTSKLAGSAPDLGVTLATIEDGDALPFVPDPNGFYVACSLSEDGGIDIQEVMHNRVMRTKLLSSPTVAEITEFFEQSGLPIARFYDAALREVGAINMHVDGVGSVPRKVLEGGVRTSLHCLMGGVDALNDIAAAEDALPASADGSGLIRAAQPFRVLSLAAQVTSDPAMIVPQIQMNSAIAAISVGPPAKVEGSPKLAAPSTQPEGCE